jgi:gamma-glutamyltranspeptidase
VQSLHLSIEAMKLALADLDRYVADEDHMAFAAKELLSDHYLKSRAALINHDTPLILSTVPRRRAARSTSAPRTPAG